MSMEKVKAILEEIRNDPKAAGMLEGVDTQKTEEEAAAAFIAAAKELGYEIAPEEFAAFLKAQAEERLTKTEEEAEGVLKLDDSEIAEAAGGSTFEPCKRAVVGHPLCKTTYKDGENCWFNDSCNIIYRKYEPDPACKMMD